MGADDLGYIGSYSPLVIGDTALSELRNLAGPAPADGKKWFMVNLSTGECKWYRAARRSSGYSRSYSRRPSSSRRRY